MGQVRHGSATTTHAVRAAIQRSQASLAQLSRELGINPKTVAKWRKRVTIGDMKTGPSAPRSTVLTEAEEAMVVAFRRHTLLPLDDCLYALQPSIPHPTRSALHRCLQRHGISRLPDAEGDKPRRQKFKRYPIGFFHIDIAEVQTEEGKLFLFVVVEAFDCGVLDRAVMRSTWLFVHGWFGLVSRCSMPSGGGHIIRASEPYKLTSSPDCFQTTHIHKSGSADSASRCDGKNDTRRSGI